MFDTIAATATPVGGALAVLRVSGPAARQILAALFSGSIAPRRVGYGDLRFEGQLLDRATAVFYPGPASFTGEDMAEFIVHGGQAVVRRVLDAILHCGARPADAGEFTRRAFLNGKLDLTEAEAVMDLISAQSLRAAESAAEQLAGSVSRRVNAILDPLVDALAGLNAAIDYPDELEEDVVCALPRTLADAAAAIAALTEDALRARVLREGARVVLAGPPNAGKSALYNALLGEDRAIVTEHAGTTRDLLPAQTQFQGLPVTLIDTAGLGEADDPIEAIGMGRAQDALAQADLVLLTFDASAPLDTQDAALLEATRDRPRLIVLNKTDLPPVLSPAQFEDQPGGVLYVSALLHQGLEELKQAAAELILPQEHPALVTNARHIQALEQAQAALQSAQAAREPDCIATDLTEAVEHLAGITGRSAAAETMDRIFERFCVGK